MARFLTRKQRQVIETIRTLIEENGYSPSVRELGGVLGLAPATIQQHLDALQAKGYISRTGSAFGITLKEETPQAGQSYTTAVIGTIAAGEPILAFEEYEDRIAVPQAMLVGSEHFALRVQGDSMIEDHILDGDLVVVRRQQSADDGEVVVALLDDGTATLKRLYRESGGFRLQPANSQLNPIYVNSLDVQGVVTGIVRQHI
ncbi:MAG: transcriptional repressor LexA [Chloroflexi bacterium]|nr:transcriptional repressor LexA [Chloroflexota bacterium]MCY3937169.1 transcriptional repressor LexA [Chloroflexota bacterium]